MIYQPGLFDIAVANQLQHDFHDIPGLGYFRYLLTQDEQVRILQEIDAQPWRNDLKRQVQHYGYKYDYKARSIDHSMYVGPLPPFAIDVAQQLINHRLTEEIPDQLIVNEYLPGQGIAAHVDCEPCFKNTIITVSLGSAYEMDFINIVNKDIKSVMLELGSALILRDEARYKWQHRIKARQNDHGVPRQRRVSLTYRNVILPVES